MSYRVLIVEDTLALFQAISVFFREKGAGIWTVVTSSNGNEALELVRSEEFDLMILDIMLPGASGFDICRAARQKGDCPIIFLTALGAEPEIMKGYETGCDDYVVKPFSPKELMARVKAVIDRMRGKENEVFRLRGLEIDFEGRQVLVDGEKAALTPKEIDLLLYMVKNKNIALSREKLLEEVWDYDYFGDDRTVDTHIKMLRHNLKDYRDHIVTIRGMGYKFEA